jgi:hypothetical protein
MSQYKISKKRLAQIIKEEYDAAMLRTDEGHGAFGIANRDEEAPKSKKKKKKDERTDEAHCGTPNRDEPKSKGRYDDGDGEDEKCDYVDCEDEDSSKKVKKESLDSIRTLIQQELKNL